jgi:hypothetical protein
LTCQEYTLRCKVNGQLPPDVLYNWDFGPGINYGQTGNEVNCLYIIPGNFTVNVQVINESSNEVVKELSAQVQFEDPSFLPVLNTLQIMESSFNPSCITLTDGNVVPNGFFYFNTDEAFTTPLTWTDSAFFAQLTGTSGSSSVDRTLSGIISSDGKTIEQLQWTIIEMHNGNVDLEVNLQIANLPVFIRDEWNCYYGFGYDLTGSEIQTYVTNIVYNEYDYQAQEWITIQNIDWANSYLYGRFYNY